MQDQTGNFLVTGRLPSPLHHSHKFHNACILDYFQKLIILLSKLTITESQQHTFHEIIHYKDFCLHDNIRKENRDYFCSCLHGLSLFSTSCFCLRGYTQFNHNAVNIQGILLDHFHTQYVAAVFSSFFYCKLKGFCLQASLFNSVQL